MIRLSEEHKKKIAESLKKYHNNQRRGFSDSEVLKIDKMERLSKLNKKYQPTAPDNLVGAVNSLNDNLNLILYELRRLNDIISYFSPPSNNENNNQK